VVLADWGIDPSLVARARDAGALDPTLEDVP
jgi:hypothetical protein